MVCGRQASNHAQPMTVASQLLDRCSCCCFCCLPQAGDLKYMVAFASAPAALQWALLVQEAAMYLDYPPTFERVQQVRSPLQKHSWQYLCTDLTPLQKHELSQVQPLAAASDDTTCMDLMCSKQPVRLSANPPAVPACLLYCVVLCCSCAVSTMVMVSWCSGDPACALACVRGCPVLSCQTTWAGATVQLAECSRC